MQNLYGMCGVILAAGASSRMGTDKALLPWPPAASGHTLLSAAIASLKPFTQAIVVVVGKNARNLAPVIAANGALMVLNPEPERGQFSSFQIGLRQVLALGHNAAIITLVDCPPLSAPSLQHLRVSFDRALALGKWGVAPEKDGKHGHPLLAGPQLIEAFLQAPLASNAREVKRLHAHLIESIPVPDSLLTVDVNTPEEYAALAAQSAAQPAARPHERLSGS